ncbi:MAG: hypothetical protein OSB28_02710 [Flavobacteriales bacterium]|nr:hypothetical protein [Flavobacteriales bacterium]
MKKTIFLSIIILFILCSGCTKITEIAMMKGEWQVLEVKINGGDLNQLEQLFPQFDTTGRYLIYMMDDGVMKGEYYIGDILDFEAWGEWELLSNDYVFMRIDEYINGTFLIRSNGDHLYTMYSDSNDIAFYDIGISTMVLELERH